MAGLLPVADRRVAAGRGVERHRPQVEIHRLARLQVGESRRKRHAAVGGPVVLAVGHDRVVGGQHGHRLQLAGRHFQLVGHRIGLDIDAPRGERMLLVQHGGPAQVDQRVAAPVEIAQAAGREPEALVAAPVERAVGPPVAQPDGRERPMQVADRVARVLGDGVGHRVVGPRGVVLHVPDLVPEPLEAAQPVEIEPGLPAEGTAAHHAQDHEHATGAHAQRSSGTAAAADSAPCRCQRSKYAPRRAISSS